MEPTDTKDLLLLDPHIIGRLFWLAGAVLWMIGAKIPGGPYVWLAIAAASIGGVAVVNPDPYWPIQVLLLLAALGVRLLFFRRVTRPGEDRFRGSARPGAKQVGRVMTLTDPIKNGRGRLVTKKGPFIIEGSDMPRGSKVRIIDADGMVLRVEPAE